MKALKLETMSIDDLWQLYEQVRLELAKQLSLEKRKIEQRLSQMRGVVEDSAFEDPRRPYPKVDPKYQNPDNPSQTWAGRGKTPRWISEMLAAGKTIDDLRIDVSEI